MVAIKCWKAFVPISVEEKRKELRRAELRRKVCQWLPDYQPSQEITDND